MSLGRVLAPNIGKTLFLSALAGAASEGVSQIVKKISGNGKQTDQLTAHKHLLTEKQKQDILNALQSGSSVNVRPTKTQPGGFMGSLLASIGVPLLINALTGKSGSSAPRMGNKKTPGTTKDKGGNGMVNISSYRPPPFYGNWPGETICMGTKQKAPKKKKKKKGKGLLLGKNSPFNGIPLLGAIF